MSSASSDSQKIVLKTSDSIIFKVDKAVGTQSQTIKHTIKDNCADTCIPLPNVTSKILAKVIEYCERHAEAAAEAAADEFADVSDLIAFDAEFVKVDKSTLFNLLSAANYLSIRSLIDLTSKAIVDMMKGKTPEEIQKTFNIKYDFTPEEEEKFRQENAWAFK